VRAESRQFPDALSTAAVTEPNENQRKEEEEVEEGREDKRSKRSTRGQKTSMGKARQTGNQEDTREAGG